MARRCEICGKGRMVGHNVSHSNIKTKKVFNPNLQKVKVRINGETKHIRVCTKCLKKGKIQKAI